MALTDYNEWRAAFAKDKREVATLPQSSTHAVHSIVRYLDTAGVVWETAITYTGRVVIRSGALGADGVTVGWGEWTTLHDVRVPKSP